MLETISKFNELVEALEDIKDKSMAMQYGIGNIARMLSGSTEISGGDLQLLKTKIYKLHDLAERTYKLL
ncbi:unnamed protein product [marine sediment metagenome]|uniref:Uncharacterized protein n=1 Tax=marine sediment metagenome TaxID=412755 RepID=X0VIP2_9ZZZZ